MRFYIDTSVWGGYFDNEFKNETQQFFEQVIAGNHQIVVSDEVTREIIKAPERITGMFLSLKKRLEIMSIDEKVIDLANRYVKEGALTNLYLSDALHISCATVAKVDVLVSWNFTHMVNFFRIKQYNEINRKFGYNNIDIRSPKEVMDNKNKPNALEPVVSYGESIDTMKMVREIRDELSELYWKDPAAYLKESQKYTIEYLEAHYKVKNKSGYTS